MLRKKSALPLIILLGFVVVLLIAAFCLSSFRERGGTRYPSSHVPQKDGSMSPSLAERVALFGSDTELRNFLAKSHSAKEARLTPGIATMDIATGESLSKSAEQGTGGAASPRFSETNVQKKGIDEPDIVKTDGKKIYASREPEYRYFDPPISIMEKQSSTAPVTDTKIVPPSFETKQETAIIDIVSGGGLTKIGTLPVSGEFLIFDTTLVVFEASAQKVVGYDISDAKNPKSVWTHELKDASQVISARKYDSTLYLVEKTWADQSLPCPFIPFSINGTDMMTPCTGIYYAPAASSADAVFTAVAMDPKTGTVRDTVSFLGAQGESVVFMSEEGLYITYPRSGDPFAYMLNFFRQEKGILPSSAFEKLEKLSSYDISVEAKMTELSQIIETAFTGKNNDDALALRTEMTNRLSSYSKAHARELESTGIVKLRVSDLDIVAQGSVPGKPLNQYSLDEYEGNLRIATTASASGMLGMFVPRDATTNDVYVLGSDLNQRGAVLDLGVGERVYSARFIGDRGYVVTFRDTDPFYVLDLSSPENPTKTGELKIPGYSSYLHPLSENRILGVGMEEGKVKLSLFDISSPSEPREVARYMLDEYWSEAISNPRAFLADPEKNIFFLPGGQGGFVFSYDNDTLSLAKAVKDDRVKRALFVGDTFFIVSNDAIYFYDERTWEKKGKLQF